MDSERLIIYFSLYYFWLYPNVSLQYIPQEKTDVKSGTNQVDFILKRLRFMEQFLIPLTAQYKNIS